MNDVGKLLVIIGIVLVVVGAVIWRTGGLGGLGRLKRQCHLWLQPVMAHCEPLRTMPKLFAFAR